MRPLPAGKDSFVPRSRLAFFRVLLLIVVLAASLPAGLAAQDASTPPPGGTPAPATGPLFVFRPKDDVDGAFFTVEAEAGTSHTLTAVLGNVGQEPLSLETYAGDAFTLVNGGFGVREKDEPRDDVSTWFDYETETYDFAPGEGVERSFTVSVPEGTPPGQYIAGIVLQTAEPVEIEGSSMFNQVVRKSVAVFITVPGEMTPSFAFGTPEIQTNVAGQRIVVPVSNTGNVLVKPAGELVLTDASGTAAFRQPFAMGSVYAGMETTLEVALPPTLPEGTYSVSATVSDPETGARATVPATELTLSREIVAEAPLEITAATVTPMPDAGNIQFATVAVTVENRELPVEGVRVVLEVARDGEPVEDFVLASSVTLQQGETVIEQRYLPLEGWSDGEWTFTVTLESIDPQTSAEAVLLTVEVDESITIGEAPE